MNRIVIVSGCPGGGKTTLSKALVEQLPRGLHIPSDLFYEFPARLIEPTEEASHHQNTVIMQALARSARAFAEGGYGVVIDGIVGPWFLPTLCSEWPDDIDLSYIVLRTSEAQALRRVCDRDGPGSSARVRHMVKAFADVSPYEAHVVETETGAVAETFESVKQGLEEGRFALDRRDVLRGTPQV